VVGFIDIDFGAFAMCMSQIYSSNDCNCPKMARQTLKFLTRLPDKQPTSLLNAMSFIFIFLSCLSSSPRKIGLEIHAFVIAPLSNN